MDTLMNSIRGTVRLAITGMLLSAGALAILLTAWIPVTIRRYRPAFWFLQTTACSILAVLGVTVACPEAERLRQLRGFVFPNHVSYLDILVLLAVAPVRFLAKAEVQRIPVIGIMARAIGCVFVNREDSASRGKARQKLAHIDRFPAVVLFPEGKRGPGDVLLPFRYGAFEIVVQGTAAFLPCAITYDRLDIALWPRDETLLKAIWRLSRRSGRIEAYVYPLDAVTPDKDADPIQLSQQIHGQMTAVLQQHQWLSAPAL
jgi:1-acyl-sn-glycerol-3-phosphate acyltransferase